MVDWQSTGREILQREVQPRDYMTQHRVQQLNLEGNHSSIGPGL